VFFKVLKDNEKYINACDINCRLLVMHMSTKLATSLFLPVKDGMMSIVS
jgi:hypothetical protein